MHEAADGSASTPATAAERLAVRVVTGAGAADPLALAKTDLATIQGSVASFAVVSAPAHVSVGNRDMVRAAFTSTEGTNAVTGKPNPFTTAVYYIAKDATTLAVVRFSVETSQFDPQGSNDVAATFAWR